MPAVADSSVIIYLSAIAQFDLLRQIHGSVLSHPPSGMKLSCRGRDVREPLS
jgi:hypothetical protein